MTTNLTELQKLKASIVATLNFDVDKAKKVFNFIIGNESTSAPEMQQCGSNGVYYVLEGGRLSPIDNLKSISDEIIGVAVKMGDKIATVSLHDAADGEEIALTTDTPCGSEKFFHPDFFDAITDWDGEANTKDYGDLLNPEIGLQEGQYIPSLAQLHLILLNIKEVNKALEAVGGSPMRKEWHWSSTEDSAHHSWYVHFSSGGSNSYLQVWHLRGSPCCSPISLIFILHCRASFSGPAIINIYGKVYRNCLLLF